jgi:hypothetical protein
MARENYAQTQLPTDGKSGIPYPDYHKIVQGLLLHGSEAFCGTVTGTGAAIEVETPFDPAAVILFNRTDPTLALKLPGMAGDDCMKLTDAPALTYVTANGVTLSVASGKGFTIGTDADLNVAAEVIEYIAFGVRDVGGGV